MNKIFFSFKNAILALKNKKLLNIVVTITIAAGLFLPMVYICSINYGLKVYASEPFFYNIEKTIVVEGFFNQNQTKQIQEELLNVKTKQKNVVQTVGYALNIFMATEYKNQAEMSTVGALSPNYNEITRCELVQGRYITKQEFETGANVVLVDARSRSKYNLGDTISIANTKYTIVGKIVDTKLYAVINVPYNTFKKIVNPKTNVQGIFYATVDTAENTTQVLKKSLFKDYNIISKLTAEEKHEYWNSEFVKPIKKQIAMGAVLLLFTIISFVLIVSGRLMQEKYTIAVKIAIGASNKMLFLDTFIQNFLIVQLAGIIDCILMLILMPRLIYFNFLMDWSFLGNAEILCVCLAILITSILYFKVYKTNIVETLKAK